MVEAVLPQNLKGYELRERIGAGGFGAVFRAYQSTVGREVAIKFILPGLANQPDFIRRFEGEAQLVARLEHPHITPLYDYWRDPEGAYLVMRWLRGGSLRDALQNSTYDLRSGALLLDQVAGALSLAHRNNVIHRDIKPGNILLDEDGNAYLTDFGIAKDLNLPGNNTQPDAIVGSLDYISPEQARSEPITPRTDIYSLGVTLYEVITGEHPFRNLSTIERLYKHINDPLPEITSLDDSVSTEVNRVIQKATAKNPEHRYPDALAFAADFREAIGMNRTPSNIVELLTQREHEILQLIIEGLPNKEIAQRLTVTLSTVKWHVNQIYTKLGVRSRVQAIVRARELNLLAKPSEALPVAQIPTEDFQPVNPYKGLHAFQSADNLDFFGREKVTAKLLKRLEESHDFVRFLAVIGPSGSGKSSLIKAGLIPALWRGEIPGSEKWFIVEMQPGEHPLDELEIALTRVAANQSGSVREQLVRDRRGLIRAAQLILPNDASELLLVIDQFEEMFTLLEDEAARTQFLDLLYAAVTEQRSRVRVVLTLRADFYDRPLHYADFGELLRSRMETVLPLSAQELERAISKPAERVGASFEPGLVASIVAEVNYQAGALPLLQYALTELFEQRQGRLLTRETYDTLGGSVGALARRADEVYQGFDATSQEAARQMFLRLVTLGEGTEDTRRRVTRSELLAITSDSDVMDEVIDTYVQYRLLSLDNDPGTRSPTVEVAHEALLREWERLREWLSESRDEIKLQRQLGMMAAEWRESKQDNSFLAHGARLEQFEKWISDTKLALTGAEHTYLKASIAQRALEEKAEAERQAQVKALERRSVRFLRALVAVLLLAALGAFGLSLAALNNANVAQQERDKAEQNFVRAEKIRLSAQAQVVLGNGDSGEVAALLSLRSLELGYSPEADASLVGSLTRGFSRQVFEGGDALNSGGFSLDGHYLLTTGFDNKVILWDAKTGQDLHEFVGHSEIAWAAAFSPDEKLVLTGAGDKTMRVWSRETGEEIYRLTTDDDVRNIVYSADNSFIMVLSLDPFGGDMTVLILDAETYQQLHRFLIVDGRWAAISPDNQTLATSGPSGEITIWDIATETVLHQKSFTREWGRIAYTPDGQQIAIAGSDGTWLLDSTSLESIRQFGDFGPVDGMAISPDGQYLGVGDNELHGRVWNIKTGEVVHVFIGHHNFIWSTVFSPDSRFFLTISHDGTARLWDIQQASEPRVFCCSLQVAGLDLSPDGRSMVTSSYDSLVRLWDVQTGKLSREFKSLADNANVALFSPDGQSILSVGESPEGILWDVQTGSPRKFSSASPSLQTAAFSPDGKTFLTGGSGLIELRDVATLTVLHHYSITNGYVRSVAFSPNGQTFASSGQDGLIRIWDVKSEAVLSQFSPDERLLIPAVSFSPDGRYLLAGSVDHIATLWDVQTKELIRQFVGHTGRIFAVAFSPDGQSIVTTGGDDTTRLWNVETGQEIRRLVSRGGDVMSVAFSPDGQSVATGLASGETFIWSTKLDAVVAFACAHLPRDLNAQELELYNLDDHQTCP